MRKSIRLNLSKNEKNIQTNKDTELFKRKQNNQFIK